MLAYDRATYKMSAVEDLKGKQKAEAKEEQNVVKQQMARKGKR